MEGENAQSGLTVVPQESVEEWDRLIPQADPEQCPQACRMSDHCDLSVEGSRSLLIESETLRCVRFPGWPVLTAALPSSP